MLWLVNVTDTLFMVQFKGALRFLSTVFAKWLDFLGIHMATTGRMSHKSQQLYVPVWSLGCSKNPRIQYTNLFLEVYNISVKV